jgi:hypothetical protein
MVQNLRPRFFRANAIIYYNTLLLSWVYKQKLAADGQEAIKILSQ